ncbi:hypothetical protein [Nonomuraea sp. NPDC049695]|uniref:hypothetical protein n=1 Tax=Nonomuraea sp. NPDC049695 TaxID=3154734 RepID=UPI0034157008
MSWFRRAAVAGHEQAAIAFDGASVRLGQAPWNTDGALPLDWTEAPAAQEPSGP